VSPWFRKAESVFDEIATRPQIGLAPGRKMRYLSKCPAGSGRIVGDSENATAGSRSRQVRLEEANAYLSPHFRIADIWDQTASISGMGSRRPNAALGGSGRLSYNFKSLDEYSVFTSEASSRAQDRAR
jgi:hypothetical protein